MLVEGIPPLVEWKFLHLRSGCEVPHETLMLIPKFLRNIWYPQDFYLKQTLLQKNEKNSEYGHFSGSGMRINKLLFLYDHSAKKSLTCFRFPDKACSWNFNWWYCLTKKIKWWRHPSHYIFWKNFLVRKLLTNRFTRRYRYFIVSIYWGIQSLLKHLK